ncbi:MAG: class I mannose-6-phosphate isomerase [Ruminococcaceae bacterium]|jgi:mannose-6-phosphate isomerase|nr:class I mannose-6-phosphate isomerase [Oscillospiraceae bacterium]
MLPFQLIPVYKDYLWGGTKLKEEFHKQTDLERIAESWELSAHPDGESIIADGDYSGTKFSEFVKQVPEFMGTRFSVHTNFPVLVKLIDAQKPLSIQVHPDDAYARRNENGLGKTEMWYILGAEPGAFLYFGCRHIVSKEEMRCRLSDGTVTEILQKMPVKKGDVFFIPAGTIHAIGAGILLAEIQQNSNTTYRVYDYGRLDVNGKPRALHLEKALEVADLRPASADAPNAAVLERTAGYSVRRLARCDYFNVEKVELDGSYIREMDGGSFVFILCTDGDAKICYNGAERTIFKGGNLFIPSCLSEVTLSGQGSFLFTTL